MLVTLRDNLLDLLFPSRCPGCGVEHRMGICPGCVLEIAGKARGDCGGAGFGREVAFDSWRAAGEYSGVLKAAILQFKDGCRPLAGPLSSLMLLAAGNHPSRVRPCAVAFVPSERRKVARRGFNPAMLLARNVAARLGRPLVCALEVIGRPADQDSLGLVPRWDNAGRAFRVRGAGRVRGNVLLVDDVLTTGATCDACARLLIESGASSVNVLVAGRATLRRKDVFFSEIT